jgi:hypothetical protein
MLLLADRGFAAADLIGRIAGACQVFCVSVGDVLLGLLVTESGLG